MSFQLEWKVIKKREIEEKLQKLGVEPGAGNGVPQIHAPHGRATSVWSFFHRVIIDLSLNSLVTRRYRPQRILHSFTGS